MVNVCLAGHVCPGDCDGDRRVEVSELTRGVATALGRTAVRFCPPMDVDSDGSVGVVDLVAAVDAAIRGCPRHPTRTETPTATATATVTETPTPVYDPQIPPANTVDLQSWLRQAFYRDWRRVSELRYSYHQIPSPMRGERRYLNEALYTSLVCDGVDPHPKGAAAVQELFDLGNENAVGWSVNRKLQADSDEGRGWYWYQEFDGRVLAAGSGVGECVGCHSDGEFFLSHDYYAWSFLPYLASCRRIPESDGGVCTDLGLPPLAEPYEGEVETASGTSEPATLYVGTSIFLNGVRYYGDGTSGTFVRRFCGSHVTNTVRGELIHLPEDEIEFWYGVVGSDRPWERRFRGRRRTPGSGGAGG